MGTNLGIGLIPDPPPKGYAQLLYNGSKWLNNRSRDLQNGSNGRGTSTTKCFELRMRILRSLKSTIALVRKDFM